MTFEAGYQSQDDSPSSKCNKKEGIREFTNSTLLNKLNAQDYKGAAAQVDRWNKAKGKVVQGLSCKRTEVV